MLVMKQFMRKCFFVVSTITLCGLMTLDGFAEKTLAINPVFSPILSTIQQGTSVPIRLPLLIPNEYERLFAEIPPNVPSPTTYTIDLVSDPQCFGTDACHFGSISGWNIDSNAPPLTGITIILQNGNTAYLTWAPTCNAGCAESTLLFDISGYRYEVGIKGFALPQLLRMANSFQLVPQPSSNPVTTRRW
jgi:hypothetical protein